MHPTDEPLGSAHRAPDGRWELRFERRLAHPPEKVWRALTESAHLRAWLPTDLVGERRAGAALELPFWPEVVERYGDRIGGSTVMHGEIRTWEPPAVFEWTWDVDVLRWELAPHDGGTLLTLTTRLGDPELPPADPAAGYHDCLHRLALSLDGRTPPWPSEDDVAQLERRYAAAADRWGSSPAVTAAQR